MYLRDLGHKQPITNTNNIITRNRFLTFLSKKNVYMFSSLFFLKNGAFNKKNGINNKNGRPA